MRSRGQLQSTACHHVGQDATADDRRDGTSPQSLLHRPQDFLWLAGSGDEQRRGLEAELRQAGSVKRAGIGRRADLAPQDGTAFRGPHRQNQGKADPGHVVRGCLDLVQRPPAQTAVREYPVDGGQAEGQDVVRPFFPPDPIRHRPQAGEVEVACCDCHIVRVLF